jgi:RNA polymerase sigma-70 factor, ECF subfamily
LFRQSVDGTRGENVTDSAQGAREAARAEDSLAGRFETERPHLRAVAYRMLGSLSEADDVVQEAWLRLNRSDTSEVENFRGWLTTVVARLCLDALRSRRSRREDLVGFQLPDPVIGRDSGAPDPEHEVLLADSVGLAMLVVLEQLTPPERLAFVLHDVFAVPFDEIATIVGRTPDAARQLASRARRRVRGTDEERQPDERQQRRLIDAFLAAAREGNFAALIKILDPEVVVRADFGLGPGPGRTEARGAHDVASQALLFRNLAPGARPALVNGAPGLVVFSAGHPYAVVAFDFAGSAISGLYIMADRDRLERMDFSVLDS